MAQIYVSIVFLLFVCLQHSWWSTSVVFSSFLLVVFSFSRPSSSGGSSLLCSRNTPNGGVPPKALSTRPQSAELFSTIQTLSLSRVKNSLSFPLHALLLRSASRSVRPFFTLTIASSPSESSSLPFLVYFCPLSPFGCMYRSSVRDLHGEG